MALSLLQHVRDTRRTTLVQHVTQHMNADQAAQVVDLIIPLVLAHLVHLNQHNRSGLVVALLNTQAQDGLWQTLDHNALIQHLSKTVQIDSHQAQVATNEVAHAVLVELHDLYDQASLGEDGLSELLNEQPALLQGHAPDWVWHIAQLDALSGQAAVVPADPQELTVESGIAELSALMRGATQEKPEMSDHNQPHDTTHNTSDNAAHDDLHHHHAVPEPVHRAAGPLARVIAPVVALALLVLLVLLYQNNRAEQQAGRLVAPEGRMQGVTETAAMPAALPATPDAMPAPTEAEMPLPPQAMPEPSSAPDVQPPLPAVPTTPSDTTEPQPVKF